MSRLTEEDLRRSTLQRQFPAIPGTGPEAVLAVLRRLGPIQSQVPRSPFLTLASRLPGTRYETVRDLFGSHRLVKASSIRGTVFTSTADQLGALDAVARHTRHAGLAKLLGPGVPVEEVCAVIEAFCAEQWRTRDEIVTHVVRWLRTRNADAAARVTGFGVAGYLWGHSGLLRRPKDDAWEKRTDIYRRTAKEVLPDLRAPTFDEALLDLVRVHLGAYGPATRDDLAFFLMVRLGEVGPALAVLGEEVVRLAGPAGADYLDLADPPGPGDADPGLRLLPEFDGLLLGYAGRNRHRFLTAEQLSRVWAKVNGLFSPVVLHDGRLVATWRTVVEGRLVRVEVQMLPPHPVLSEGLFEPQVRALETALNLAVADVVVAPADR